MTHLAFIDTETTGLDIDTHEIWELALIIQDHPTVPQYDGEWLFQFPVSLDAASEQALKMTDFINRYQCWDKRSKIISKPDLVRTSDEMSNLIGPIRTAWHNKEIETEAEYRAKTYEIYNTYARVQNTYITPDLLDLIVVLTDGAHLVGAVPDFDAYRLDRLIKKNPVPQPNNRPSRQQRGLWHYHLIDIENLAVGYLAGRAQEVLDLQSTGDLGTTTSDLIRFVPQLPWKSDLLSGMVGVKPPTDDERHTALGDARWAKRVYERIMQ